MAKEIVRAREILRRFVDACGTIFPSCSVDRGVRSRKLLSILMSTGMRSKMASSS